MIRRATFLAVFLIFLAACEGEPPLTYISLGDSLAVGVGSSDPRKLGYAPLYRDALENETGRKVNLVQLGVSGETSDSFAEGEPSQLGRATNALKNSPRAAVTLSIGGNDLLHVSGATDAEREVAIAHYGENLDRILRALKDASSSSPRITLIALYNPDPGSFTDTWTGKLNDEMRDVATRNGVTVAATDSAFRGHEVEYAHNPRYPWDIHPTDAGYEAIVQALLDAQVKDREL